MAAQPKLDQVKLKAFENAAAGHDGVLADESGELLVKPCTQAEIDFYQESMRDHPKFYELMPTFLGTLQLGASAHVTDITAPTPKLPQTQKDLSLLHGQKISTETAIVLENLEYGFRKPNVLDLKLGSRLYADGTKPEKAERLDKVAAETTSGSLNFRIAGMKIWNGESYDVYDKFYGRKFNRHNVKDAFATFFASLKSAPKLEEGRELLETILAEIIKARHSLERSESRMYSASILIVYEGDSRALDENWGHVKTPRLEERAPTNLEIKQSFEEEEDEEALPVSQRVKMIDFAHAAWLPGAGPDENVIKGLKNIEDQMDIRIASFDD